MVFAACSVHRWNRSDGWAGSAAAELISFPGSLDVTVLDSGYRTWVADTPRGAQPNSRYCPRSSASVEHSAVGNRVILHGCFHRASAFVRGRSESGDGRILR